MRPTREESDLEFWLNARKWWADKMEAYFLIDDREGEERCERRLFAIDLAYREALGEIIVYSGRRKPEWAK